jgi:hypothetical protein
LQIKLEVFVKHIINLVAKLVHDQATKYARDQYQLVKWDGAIKQTRIKGIYLLIFCGLFSSLVLFNQLSIWVTSRTAGFLGESLLAAQ